MTAFAKSQSPAPKRVKHARFSHGLWFLPLVGTFQFFILSKGEAAHFQITDTATLEPG